MKTLSDSVAQLCVAAEETEAPKPSLEEMQIKFLKAAHSGLSQVKYVLHEYHQWAAQENVRDLLTPEAVSLAGELGSLLQEIGKGIKS